MNTLQCTQRATAALLWIAPVAAQTVEGDLRASLRDYELATIEAPSALSDRLTVRVELEAEAIELDLLRKSVWTDDAVIEIHNGDGSIETMLPPEPSTYTGTVKGLPGSRVSAVLGPDGWLAVIRPQESEQWVVHPVKGSPGIAVVYGDSDRISKPRACDSEGLDQGPVRLEPWIPPTSSSAVGATTHVARIGIDTDAFYYVDVGASNAHVIVRVLQNLLIANNEAYSALNIEHALAKLVIRPSIPAGYPYPSPIRDNLLAAIHTEWTTNQASVDYDLVQLLTGLDTDSPGGAGLALAGAAYLGTICQRGAAGGWGFSEYRSDPIEQYNIFAHEIGHQWNARHCNQSGMPCNGVGSCRLMCSSLGSCDFDYPNHINFASCNQNQVIAFRNTLNCLDAVSIQGTWVDWSQPFSTLEDGSFELPYLSLTSALAPAGDAGLIYLDPGQSSTSLFESFPIVISENVTLQAVGGTATFNN